MIMMTGKELQAIIIYNSDLRNAYWLGTISPQKQEFLIFSSRSIAANNS